MTDRWLVVDIETDGDPWTGTLVCIGVGTTDGEDVAAVRPGDPLWPWVLQVLADPTVGIVEHTLYDARWLRLHGIEVQGPIADTRVMAWNKDENSPSFKLEDLVFRYCHHKMDKRITKGSHPKFKCDDGTLVPISEAPWYEMHRYNTDDVIWTGRLFETLLPQQPPYWGRQVEMTSILLDMECRGVPMDVETLEWTRESLSITRDSIRADLTKDLPPAFNLNSDDQVAALLFLDSFTLPGRIRKGDDVPDGFTVVREGRLWTHGTWQIEGYGLTPGGWTDSGKRPKVDAKTLAVKYSNHPWVATYLEYQSLNKLVGTYLDALPRFIHDGRLYGTFNQAGTVTGRLSSQDPNLQNQPRRGKYGELMRKMFKGDLVVADFSQLEPRLSAHFSRDPELLRIFRQGLDIYKMMGEIVFDVPYATVNADQRDRCKELVLTMNYMGGARTMAARMSMNGYPTTQREAQKYIDATKAGLPTFYETRERIIEESHERGYITTLGGRERHIVYGKDGSYRAERQAYNSLIQGSAADVVDGTMYQCANIESVSLLLQVHDELVFEHRGDPDLKAIQYAGEHGHGYELAVPLIFKPKIVQTWGDK